MKRLIFLSLVAFLLASCAQEEVRMPEVSGGEATTVRSLDDALKIADSFLVSLDDNTRSGSRTVESVEYLGGNAGTRSEDGAEQPMYYVVNYADDQGFAILSADARLTPVLAISPEGSVNLADTLTNPVFGAYINRLLENESSMRRVAGSGGVSVSVKLDEVVKPLLPLSVRKWDQITYNDSVRYRLNGNPRTAVGCVPLATAQIFAFFKHPSNITIKGKDNNYHTYYFNWDEIIAGRNRSQLCKLFDILGSKGFYNSSYTQDSNGNGSTGSDTRNYYKSVFTQFKYVFPTTGQTDDCKTFDRTMAASCLRNNRTPILMRGSGYYYDVDKDVYKSEGGHCWVIDGYATAQTLSTIQNPYSRTLYYFHMCWGKYDSNCNGYYLYNDTDATFNRNATGYASDDKKGYNLGVEYRSNEMIYNYLPYE